MKKESRLKNTVMNFVSNIGGQLLTLVLQFVVRTQFIVYLGEEYLGINGLFSNILMMLSLAELGIGDAIIFRMYEPIAKNDCEKVASIVAFSRKAYYVISAVIFGLGLTLIPFLSFFVKDYDTLAAINLNAPLVFGIYLLKVVSSYLFYAYKAALVKARQKEYVLNLVCYVSDIILAVMQIFALAMFRSFYVYIILMAVETIIRNILCGVVGERLFKEYNVKNPPELEKKEIKGIFGDCRALLLYKLNDVVLKSTDHIVISKFLGLAEVGKYSNYYIFYTTIQTLFNKVYNSVMHSLGDLHTEKDDEKEYSVFETVCFVGACLGGTAGVGIAVCADEVIACWIGEKWVLGLLFSILMGAELYTMSFRQILLRYRNSMGLFRQYKYRPIASMLINVILSVWLVNVMGLCGVIIGTIAADWLTTMWLDPIVVHKFGFGKREKVIQYFWRLFKYTLVTGAMGLLDYMICSRFFTGAGWASAIVHSLICLVSVPLALFLVSLASGEGRTLICFGIKLLSRRKGNERGI